ncbi:MAG: helicase-exonuclease AddAB subunit AddA [Oscillospiraceae bacterium]|jgi:ATP-dependent helicase/nuclease subunit A
MSSERWTEDQLFAINTTDKAVIVSAAAGSGKTAVLIERTIRLLCDETKKIPADRLLAVTFTNDAASQMREKLDIAIAERIEHSPVNEWLQLQQVKLQTAKISTINSFCFNLVKENIHNFDISSGVRILDETEYAVMKANALDAVLEKYYSEKPDMMKQLLGTFCLDSDKNLAEIIMQLFEFSRSLPFKESWFKNALKGFEKDSELQSFWKSVILDELKDGIMSLYTAVLKAKKYADSLSFHTKAKNIIDSDVIYAESLLNDCDYNNWDNAINLINSILWERFSKAADKSPDKKVSEAENAIVEYIHTIRKNYLDSYKKFKGLFSYSQAQIEQDMEKSRDVLKALLEISDALWNELWAQKVLKNAIDFADVEILSIRLLARETENGIEKTELAKSLVSSGEYAIILIDEYQDVNNLQDIIFKMLSDSEENNIIGRNMFVVGDVKQSIYRFRQANPKIFIQTGKDASKPENSGFITQIRLKKNFRSRKCVIDFVNFVFERIMSEKTGEVFYNEDEALDLGASYDDREVSTEIILIDTASEDDSEDGEENTPLEESEAVAYRIRKMLDEGYPVWEGGTLRPCRQSDFCVLMRSKTVTKNFIKAFKEAGLSVLSEELTGYLRSREISILINMLSVIDSPINDTAMASVLLSPLFMFDADELSQMKILFPHNRLYTAITKITGGALSEKYGGEFSVIEEKCRCAYKKISELRFSSSSLTLERLISRIYDSTDFFSVASAFSDGKQKRANLRLLLEYANAYDDSINGGLSGFIRYINTIFKNKKDFNQAGEISARTDAVEIKTIHKSKGLEYPFVFLCRTSTSFTKQKQELSKQLLINLSGGIGLHLKDVTNHFKYSTLAYDAVKKISKNEMLSEEMRLLYVALTRAKERLFITFLRKKSTDGKIKRLADEISSAGGISPSISASAESMQDWLTMAFLTYENDYFKQFCSDDIQLPVYKTEAIIDFVPPPDKPFEAADEETAEEKSDDFFCEKTYDEIKRYINFEYDFSLSEKTAKLSVSEVAKEDSPLEFFYAVPALNEEKGKLSAAEKGTATHSFMELCDFKSAEISVEDEAARLVERGLLTKKQGQAINISSVKAFFGGEFYKRLKISSNIMKETQFIVKISDMKLGDALLSEYNGTDGMLQGIADCVFEEEDGYVLVDYKTDNVKSTEELTERYVTQLKLYKAAFELILDKPVKSCYIYSFRLEEGIEVEV